MGETDLVSGWDLVQFWMWVPFVNFSARGVGMERPSSPWSTREPAPAGRSPVLART